MEEGRTALPAHQCQIIKATNSPSFLNLLGTSKKHKLLYMKTGGSKATIATEAMNMPDHLRRGILLSSRNAKCSWQQSKIDFLRTLSYVFYKHDENIL